MTVDWNILISLLAVLLATTSFLVSRNDRRFKEIEDIKEYLGELKDRMAKMETKVEIFWDTMRMKLTEMVKAPTHVRMDELLDKFAAKTASPDDLIELKEQLLQREQEISDNAQKLILTFALMCIDFFMSDPKEK